MLEILTSSAKSSNRIEHPGTKKADESNQYELGVRGGIVRESEESLVFPIVWHLDGLSVQPFPFQFTVSSGEEVIAWTWPAYLGHVLHS